MKDKPIIIGLAFLAIILGVRGYFTLSKLDQSAPTITFSDKAITYTEGEEYTALLEDVKAIDDKDGDVSDSLIVEKIYSDVEAKQAVVTYAAVDRSNNLMKTNRVVQYVPSETVEPTATPAPEVTEAPTVVPTTEPTVAPTVVPTPTLEPTVAPTPSPEVTVSSSPMILGSAPILYLNSNEIRIKQNAKFTIKNFVAHIVDDKDAEEVLLSSIKKDGSYNRKEKGTYEMIIYVVDSDGNESNRETVTLIVE